MDHIGIRTTCVCTSIERVRKEIREEREGEGAHR